MARDETRTRNHGRAALAVSVLAAMIVTPLVAFGVYRWLWTIPAAPKGELAELSVPAAGDLIDWSPDGKRLLVANRRGEMWQVEVSTRSVQPVTVFRPALWSAMWGPDGKPMAFAMENPAIIRMWTHEKDGWRLLPHRGIQPVPSPNRRLVAFLTGRELVREYWYDPRRRVDVSDFPPGRQVHVPDLMTGKMVRNISLPALKYPQVHWADDRTLIVRGEINQRS